MNQDNAAGEDQTRAKTKTKPMFTYSTAASTDPSGSYTSVSPTELIASSFVFILTRPENHNHRGRRVDQKHSERRPWGVYISFGEPCWGGYATRAAQRNSSLSRSLLLLALLCRPAPRVSGTRSWGKRGETRYFAMRIWTLLNLSGRGGLDTGRRVPTFSTVPSLASFRP